MAIHWYKCMGQEFASGRLPIVLCLIVGGYFSPPHSNNRTCQPWRTEIPAVFLTAKLEQQHYCERVKSELGHNSISRDSISLVKHANQMGMGQAGMNVSMWVHAETNTEHNTVSEQILQSGVWEALDEQERAVE